MHGTRMASVLAARCAARPCAIPLSHSRMLASTRKPAEGKDLHKPDGKESTNIVAGAAAAGGVMAFGILGSMTGGMVAAGAAAYATTRKDGLGDVAKAVGRAAVAAATKGRELNDEYKISERARSAASEGYRAARQLNDKYEVTDKAKAATQDGLAKARTFDEQHGVSSKLASGLTAGLNSLTSALKGGNKKPANK